MIQRAINAGVSRFFIPAIDSTCTQAMYDLEQVCWRMFFLMMGLHPTYMKDNFKPGLAHVASELKGKFYAIGEIGIDLCWDKTHLKEQQVAFRQQIQWAKQYKLPIVIHCRELWWNFRRRESPELFGIFHCFSGTMNKQYRPFLIYLLGIGGVVTFRTEKLFLEIDLQRHIVLETDSYLAPIPFRGKQKRKQLCGECGGKIGNQFTTKV